MTAAELWQDIETGEGFFTKFLRLVFLVVAAATFCFLAVLPLNWMQQAVLGVLSLVVALVVARSSDSYLITLTLMMLSLFSTLRYGYWRVTQVARYLHNPGNHWGALDIFFILCLLFAEGYTFVILFLGYFQSIWPLRRAPVALPESTDEWPEIDVLIPTYNEPLDLVRYTALGALNMDWPVEKLHVYLLDDGRRKEFETFAREAGIGYKTRPDNEYAKAGNINAALATTSSPLVAIFDADHVPTRSFLQVTVGWFLRDPKLAVLQTPHHFYSPDPFERNLGQYHVVPNEGELFYGVVQDGNDFWNSSFFCGSCAVLRREALDDIGGIAKETVTEDAHTSLRLQMKGWNTAYINIPQAAGLATERLSAHIGQRIRWARGMVQVMRIENPLLAPGLKLPQRLCYFNAMGHFLYAIPRLIFLTAPLIYLIFNHTNIPGFWLAILAYALPHLLLADLTNSRIQGEHRHSFWNDIYETVLSPYILLPTMMALIHPKLGKFNVTEKGGVIERTFFDSRIAEPFLVLLLFNIAGLAVAIPRFFIWDTSRRGTVLMNVAWCLFNVVILGVCTTVARELQQRRTAVRIKVMRPLAVKLPDGRTITGETVDMSNSGAGIRLSEALGGELPKAVRVAFPLPAVSTEVPAAVVSFEDSVLRVRFEDLSIAEQEVLAIALYSRADSWLGWGEVREPDHVLRSLGRILRVSMRGLTTTFLGILTGRDNAERKAASLSIVRSVSILFLAMVFAMGACKALAQPQDSAPAGQASTSGTTSTNTDNLANLTNSAKFANPANSGSAPFNTPVLAGQYDSSFTLADIGSPQIDLHGVERKRKLLFTLPSAHVPRLARIHLSYAFSPSLIPQLSELKLMMNGTLFATIQPAAGKQGGSDGSVEQGDFDIPANLLAHSNALTIEFIGHYTTSCEDATNSALWARVDRNSTIEIRGDRLAPADDLNLLPTPFLDPAVAQPASLPIVFPTRPSYKAIQAAGVVAGYFGMISENRPVRFPVSIGAIPAGNAIVVAENPASLPAALNLATPRGPLVAMRANPSDAYGTLLVITGPTADDALVAAQAVAMQSDVLNGAQAGIENLRLPEKQAPDAAPRWANTDQKIPLWDVSTTDELEGDGSTPLSTYFRIPPDLYFGAGAPDAVLHLAYRYNAVPIGPISSMEVRLNNAFIGAAALTPGQESSRNTQTGVSVPVAILRPFSNTLSFDFAFQLLRKQNCQETAPPDMEGAILRGSYLDLRGYPHWATLPNLELFSNAGFPFTRLADLSETAVVLPPDPTAEEIETFVTLMGHFGRQTGSAGLRVAVGGPEALHNGAGRDFLIIGSGDDQPAFGELGSHLPVSLSSAQVQVHETNFVRLLHRAWWRLEGDERTESGEVTAGGTPDAVIEGIESPYDAGTGRSIVAIHLKDATVFEPFMSTFLAAQQSSDISQSVSILRGTQFQSFLIGTQIYHVGVLTWWTRLTLWFGEAPWLAAVIAIFVAFLLAVFTRHRLRVRARARLTMTED